MCRGFLTSATAGGDDKAKEAQKTAGNPYAPTSSAGGTPTDNKHDEGHTPELLQHHVWLHLVHMCSLQPAANACNRPD